MKSAGLIGALSAAMLLGSCQTPQPPVKTAEYVWPDFKLYVGGKVVTAQTRFAAYGKCVETGGALTKRGEYETREEYEKRRNESGAGDCAGLLELSDAQLRGRVKLRYNADQQRFKFTPVTGIIHSGVLNARMTREKVWGDKHLIIYLDKFAGKPSLRSYIDGRGDDFRRYQRDGIRCKTAVRIRHKKSVFAGVHNDTNCYIPYRADRQGGYVHVPVDKNHAPQVRTRLLVGSPIDEARDLKDREDQLEIRVLGHARLFNAWRNPYHKVNMDSVVGEFTVSKIGVYDKRRDVFLLLLE